MLIQPVGVKMKTDFKVYVLGLVLAGIFKQKCIGEMETLFSAEEDEKDCPHAESRWMKSEHEIAWGTPNRAFLTLPRGLRITDSEMPGAGLGVISDIFIPNDTWLAEYEGEIIPQRLKGDISDYAWQVHRNGERFYLVDAGFPETSNWLRFINCARHKREENVKVFECYGRPFYKLSKAVKPGDELLVYYGRGYGEDLGIDVDNFSNFDITLNFTLVN